MSSLASTAVRLTMIVLLLSLAGEAVMRLTLHVRLGWFFYAAMSGGLLGFLPSAPILVRDDRTGIGFRLTFAACLSVLVLLNCWLVALANGSDLGWSKGDYLLAFPAGCYLLTAFVGFFALRTPRTREP